MDIPNSVTSIGSNAFYECSGLTSVSISNSVTSINYMTFLGCKGLTSVTIPSSVTSICEKAFYRCDGLSFLTIPSSVTTIGQNAFERCSGLSSLVSLIDSPFKITGKNSSDRTFPLDVFNNVTLYVPVALKPPQTSVNVPSVLNSMVL